jgi:RNA polymerase sigma factor (sigma-70 family)
MQLREFGPILRSLRSLRGSPVAAEPSDRSLLECFVKEGDADAFGFLLRRHGSLVLGACQRILGNHQDAEDVFQETFLVLVRKAGWLREPDRLGPWLYGVACRLARKARTRKESRRRRERPLEDSEAGPVTEAAPIEVRALLDDALARLPVSYREPLILCYLEGLTQTEAARRIGCPPGTIATRIARGREYLRIGLARRGFLSAPALAAILTPALAPGASATLLATTVDSAVALPGKSWPLSLVLPMKGVQSVMLHKWKVMLTIMLLGVIGLGVSAYRAPADENVSPPPPGAAQVEAETPPSDKTDENEGLTVCTTNFKVTAPTHRIARIVADEAERQRVKLAVRWPKPAIRRNFGGREPTIVHSYLPLPQVAQSAR